MSKPKIQNFTVCYMGMIVTGKLRRQVDDGSLQLGAVIDIEDVEVEDETIVLDYMENRIVENDSIDDLDRLNVTALKTMLNEDPYLEYRIRGISEDQLEERNINGNELGLNIFDL